LQPTKTTLLVFGGSQGAQAINRLVIEAISCNPKIFREQLQVIHIAGTQDAVDSLRSSYQQQQVNARVKDFEPRMDLAWQAADFFVGRAGAGTIAEAMEFEVPGILIPFPRAADGHQDKNADFMVKTVGGAKVYSEKELTAQELCRAISSFLEINNITRMREAIHRYKQTSRRTDFCTLIRTML
jgi:UDP-N-acetylglucosamine--N-acetylmuramyl-(pentapeptide) pyrophosphoryl-undecaprenol N-acetylglucosamine transferase